MSDNKEYLGDGVYVESNKHEIILTTENGIEIINTIYLDINVAKKLLDVLQNFINTFKKFSTGFPHVFYDDIIDVEEI